MLDGHNHAHNKSLSSVHIASQQTKFRSAKKELELQYSVEPPASAPGGGNPTIDPPAPEAITKLNSDDGQ